jgi:hypothetical protein
MGLLNQTLILYLVIGAGVAGALYLSEPAGRPGRWLRLATALPFWPLYLPILLSGPDPRSWRTRLPAAPAPRDEMATAIAQVEAELEAALGSLNGWAEGVLAREKGRIEELRAAWTAQVARIREMDRVLALPDEDGVDVGSGPAGERLRTSHEARRQNLERLRLVRARASEDLLAALARVRELVSMIHLAKFTGAPAARAEELFSQIAAAGAGLSAATWQGDGAGWASLDAEAGGTGRFTRVRRGGAG